MSNQVLYATGNKGKVMEVKQLLERYGVEVVSPKDLGIEMEVPENGKTLEDNAAMKARLYQEKMSEMLVIGDDEGLEIDALGGEPGTKVRRWKDGMTRMTDEELVEYCLEKMQAVSPEARGATFRAVIALRFPGSDETDYCDGRLRGVILSEVKESRIEGYPFGTLFYIPEWEMTLDEVHQLPDDKRVNYLTHREIAVEKAVPRILEWFAGREQETTNN